MELYKEEETKRILLYAECNIKREIIKLVTYANLGILKLRKMIDAL
jgi:hypothetical protein